MTTDAGKLYEQLQAARTELRHQAHIYVGCKHKDKFTRDRAAEALENAAVVMVALASQWGIRAGCARPAGAAGIAWEEGLDPENALNAASKIIDDALAAGKRKRRAKR